jgi:L-fuconate dehydratase
MPTRVIHEIETSDRRFSLQPGEGSDSMHSNPEYSFAVTKLKTCNDLVGVGLTLTMGAGNDLVCEAIRLLSRALKGRDIEEIMDRFGDTSRSLADDPQLRWLGPHKGVVHLALASITNACFDLWAKTRGVPLWKLLLDLSPDALVRLCDLSYLEDVLTSDQARQLFLTNEDSRTARQQVITEGYPCYDTSVGWLGFSERQVLQKAQHAIDSGFRALKLKVGANDLAADVKRARALRTAVGDGVDLMLDANQKWCLPRAITACRALAEVSPLWIEEPTHPDDMFAHKKLADQIRPTAIALGEHVANRVQFKNYFEAGCVDFVQADCTRVAGVSEFLTVSLLARKFGRPVVPHVGDMGQIHQHLVIFNHVALGHPKLFLEYIPHLRNHFMRPIRVKDGRFESPAEPGSSAELVEP